jgi:oxalate decarboxylase
MRELHWHPNASEWQYYISGSARQTVFDASGHAHSMNYNPDDVGFVPQVAGHYVQNIGNDDLVLLALFKTDHYEEISLDQWLRRLPVQIRQQHIGLTPAEIAQIPSGKKGIIGI